MKILSVLLAATVVFGCAEADMNQISSIVPNEKGFVFKTMSFTNYPEWSASAEKDRTDAMKRFVVANKLCVGGFEVFQRQVIARPPSLIGIDTMRDINYHARCL